MILCSLLVRKERTTKTKNGVKKMANQIIYNMITERVIDQLLDAIEAKKAGKNVLAPWHKPWFQNGKPQNFVTKKPYQGVNIFVLSMQGYSSPYFLSYKQATELHRDFDHFGTGKEKRYGFDKDGNGIYPLKKHEDGTKEKVTPVVYWGKRKVYKDKNGKSLGLDENGKKKWKYIWLLRYYSVFNVEQCTGFEEKIPVQDCRTFTPIESGDKIIEDMPNRPTMTHNEARAFYSPSLDSVNLPKHELFDTDAKYYSTAFHELAHSTGHKSRLNRKTITEAINFGSHDYSTEELIAEFSSIFLCNEIGVQSTFDNSLSYLKSWLKKLKDDTKLLIYAAGRAQKAVDYILDETPVYDD